MLRILRDETFGGQSRQDRVARPSSGVRHWRSLCVEKKEPRRRGVALPAWVEGSLARNRVWGITSNGPSATDEHRTSVSHPCVNYFTLRNFKGLPWVDVKLVSLRRE